MSHPVTGLRKQDVEAIPKWTVPLVRRLMKWFSRAHVSIYSATRGQWGGKFIVGGAPVCLVSYTGRRSGRTLTTPLIHIPHDGGVLLVASQGGLDTHPLWYENIQVHPDILINEFGKLRRMHARRATAAQKLALWPIVRAVHGGFDEYQARTDRDIPILICTPL